MPAYPPNHGVNMARPDFHCRRQPGREQAPGRSLAITGPIVPPRSSDRPGQRAPLDDLVDKIRAIEAGQHIDITAASASSGEQGLSRNTGLGYCSPGSMGPSVPLTDSLGLPMGMVHEWLSGPREMLGDSSNSIAPSSDDPAPPPLCLFSELAWRAIHAVGDRDSDKPAAPSGHVLWIGRSVWPWPAVLLRGRQSPDTLLRRSWFVDPPDRAGRLWAMELALGNPAVTVVVGDGRGFDRVATRRLQLAARTGQSLCLLARKYTERRTLSAAATRWAVAPRDSPTRHPRWIVRLLRCKAAIEALQPSRSQADRLLEMEWTGDQGLVCQPAPLADRTDSTPLVPIGATIDQAQQRFRRRA